ncbi:hypothetical protein Hanom_Chr14g01325451 [Helianthus anomalus]
MSVKSICYYYASVTDPRIICWGADEVFNHILKRCSQVFLPKIYTNFLFSGGAAAHLGQIVGPPLISMNLKLVCIFYLL